MFLPQLDRGHAAKTSIRQGKTHLGSYKNSNLYKKIKYTVYTEHCLKTLFIFWSKVKHSLYCIITISKIINNKLFDKYVSVTSSYNLKSRKFVHSLIIICKIILSEHSFELNHAVVLTAHCSARSLSHKFIKLYTR